MSSPRTVDVTLSRSDRDLIRKHGYPFPQIKAAIDPVPDSVDVAVVPCESFYVGQLLGDLARTINECSDDGLIERLDELYVGIESETGL